MDRPARESLRRGSFQFGERLTGHRSISARDRTSLVPYLSKVPQTAGLDISSSLESKLEQLNRLPPSPITRVSFHDALQTQALTTAVDQYYRSASATMSGDSLNAVIQSIALTGGKLKLALRGADSILVAGLLYRRLPEHRRLCTRSTASHLLFAQVDRPQVTNQQPGSCQFS
jgi:hypothetical protein